MFGGILNCKPFLEGLELVLAGIMVNMVSVFTHIHYGEVIQTDFIVSWLFWLDIAIVLSNVSCLAGIGFMMRRAFVLLRRTTQQLREFDIKPHPTFDGYFSHSDYVRERNMPGSVFLPVPSVPKCQASVGIETTPGQIQIVGQGFAYEDMFITAAHCFIGLKGLQIYIIKDGKKVVVQNPHQLMDDSVYFDLPADAKSTLGLTSSKLSPERIKANESFVGSIHADNGSEVTKTTGFLEYADRNLVNYSGSTSAGFSGAPYVVGTTVYGMHLGGDSRTNRGYASAVLLAYAKYVKRLRAKAYASDVSDFESESSEDMFFKRVKQGILPEDQLEVYRYSGANEYDIEYGGRSHIVTFDELAKIYKARTKQTGKSWKAAAAILQYDDNEFYNESMIPETHVETGAVKDGLSERVDRLTLLVEDLLRAQHKPKPVEINQAPQPLPRRELPLPMATMPTITIEPRPENWLRASAPAGAPGRLETKEDAVKSTSIPRKGSLSPKMISEISGLIGPQLMLAVQNVASDAMSNGSSIPKTKLRSLVTQLLEKQLLDY